MPFGSREGFVQVRKPDYEKPTTGLRAQRTMAIERPVNLAVSSCAFAKAEALLLSVHADRVISCDRDNCDFSGNAFAGFSEGQRKGSPHDLL